MEPDEVWDTEQVARYLKLHRRTVEKLRDAGRIPAILLGRRWRYDPEQIRALLRQREASGEKG